MYKYILGNVFCRMRNDQEFTILEFHLVIQRNPTFTNYIIVFPTILLSVSTLVIFTLPPDTSSRNDLGRLQETMGKFH